MEPCIIVTKRQQLQQLVMGSSSSWWWSHMLDGTNQTKDYRGTFDHVHSTAAQNTVPLRSFSLHTERRMKNR